jgi:hypothetical protein
VDITDPILLYRTANSIEAKSLAMHLESAGIEAHVTGETIYEAYAGLGLCQTSLVDVWTSSGDRDAAMSIANAWREKLRDENRNERPRKIQFSLISVFLLMTVVAVFACIMALNGEAGADIIAVLLSALLYLAPPTVYFYRRYSRRHPES